MVGVVAGSSSRGVVIAADTNAVHFFFAGGIDENMAVMRAAFSAGQLILPPPVLSEALSDPKLPLDRAARIRAIPLLDLADGYWDRAADSVRQ
jgi:hypothetical protein